MKRGFTLVELLAVIVILGIIGFIVITNVDTTVIDSSEKIYQAQLSNIEEAARVWAADNINYLPNNENEKLSIPLLVLKQGGVIDDDIKNPKNDMLFPNDMYIDITYKNGDYDYSVVENSGTSSSTDLDVPAIILRDTFNREISLNGSISLQGIAILRNGTTIDLSKSSSYVTINNQVNASAAGIYNYQVTVNDGKSFTITRKITVK